MSDVNFKFECIGISAYSGDAKSMVNIHSHCDIELVWIRTGGCLYEFSGIEVLFKSGGLYIFNGCFPHRLVDYAENTEVDIITFPSWHLLSWGLPESFISALFRGNIIIDTSNIEFERDSVRFNRWSSDILYNNHQHTRIFLLEIRARIERLVINDSEYTKSHTKTMSFISSDLVDKTSNIAIKVQNYILSNLNSELTLPKIASHLGKNESYISTTFKKQSGVSISGFIAEQRISQAKSLLQLTDKPIADISYEVGFGSLSRFYEAFTSRVKESPKKFRIRQRTGVQM